MSAEPRKTLTERLSDLLHSAEVSSMTKWAILSPTIGFLAGLAGVAFVWLTEFLIEHGFRAATGIVSDGIGLDSTTPAWMFLALPAIGGLLTGILVQRFAPEAEGHGTDSVVRSYHLMRGVVRKRIIALKALTSAITIGSGGSAGQEGPVAQVGAGIGSSIATALKLSDRDRRVFLLSGASAGVGAVFCSPLGGALFMPEVLYRKPEFEGEGIIPCIISSIVGYTTFTAINGAHRAVEIAPEQLGRLSFDRPTELLVYLLLGVVCTLVGLVYVKVFYGVHALFAKLTRVPKFIRPAIGGLLLGALALALVGHTGEEGVFFGGYGLIQSAISGNLAVKTLLILIAAKIIATSFTISSGGSGGVFAPALAIGALVGAVVGQTAQVYFPDLIGDPATYALVGMGGFFAGVAKVPIASIIMVSEMTGSYELLAPLMLVAVVHMLMSARWSMYEAQVNSPIDSPAHQGDFVVDVLQSIQVRDVFEGAPRRSLLVYQDTTLKEVLRIVSRAKESYFPVVDEDERLVGIFSLTDLRRIYLEDVIEDFVIVRDFMIENVITTTLGENLDEVLRRMTANNINAIPIVDSEDPGVLIGLLERNDFGRAYDRRLRALKAQDA